MEFDEMMERINELHSQRNISELKKYLNEINPADIAQLLENVFDERERVFSFPSFNKGKCCGYFR